ncbi:hypothetical protein CEXT_639081 [Caerostris extrusa]|uniref:Uncharacterized protein n=1 Tax=Caerostris extrusa TaxID=172846 RepID=A0AAV4WPF2_CAEEX|nr:hypothetical protein CEXT_639081 [Caerostris extrusa]
MVTGPSTTLLCWKFPPRSSWRARAPLTPICSPSPSISFRMCVCARNSPTLNMAWTNIRPSLMHIPSLLPGVKGGEGWEGEGGQPLLEWPTPSPSPRVQ